MFDLSILVGDESYRMCYKCNNAGMLNPHRCPSDSSNLSTNGGFKRQTFSVAFISGFNALYEWRFERLDTV